MKKQLLKLVSFLFLFTFVATNYLLSETILISDKIKIIDGDTILLDNKKIRFSGIDAPETKFKGKQQFCLKNKKKINCGKISKDSLTEKIINKKLKCLIEPQKDYFGRYLGEWASQILGYDEEKKNQYIQDVIKADFAEAGDEDVYRKLYGDLKDKNISEDQIRKKMQECNEKATTEVS